MAKNNGFRPPGAAEASGSGWPAAGGRRGARPSPAPCC